MNLKQKKESQGNQNDGKRWNDQNDTNLHKYKSILNFKFKLTLRVATPQPADKLTGSRVLRALTMQ
jgi:hypothetical protein